jgi:hypothetical protein
MGRKPDRAQRVQKLFTTRDPQNWYVKQLVETGHGADKSLKTPTANQRLFQSDSAFSRPIQDQTEIIRDQNIPRESISPTPSYVVSTSSPSTKSRHIYEPSPRLPPFRPNWKLTPSPIQQEPAQLMPCYLCPPDSQPHPQSEASMFFTPVPFSRSQPYHYPHLSSSPYSLWDVSQNNHVRILDIHRWI